MQDLRALAIFVKAAERLSFVRTRRRATHARSTLAA